MFSSKTTVESKDFPLRSVIINHSQPMIETEGYQHTSTQTCKLIWSSVDINDGGVKDKSFHPTGLIYGIGDSLAYNQLQSVRYDGPPMKYVINDSYYSLLSLEVKENIISTTNDVEFAELLYTHRERPPLLTINTVTQAKMFHRFYRKQNYINKICVDTTGELGRTNNDTNQVIGSKNTEYLNNPNLNHKFRMDATRWSRITDKKTSQEALHELHPEIRKEIPIDVAQTTESLAYSLLNTIRLDTEDTATKHKDVVQEFFKNRGASADFSLSKQDTSNFVDPGLLDNTKTSVTTAFTTLKGKDYPHKEVLNAIKSGMFTLMSVKNLSNASDISKVIAHFVRVMNIFDRYLNAGSSDLVSENERASNMVNEIVKLSYISQNVVAQTLSFINTLSTLFVNDVKDLPKVLTMSYNAVDVPDNGIESIITDIASKLYIGVSNIVNRSFNVADIRADIGFDPNTKITLITPLNVQKHKVGGEKTDYDLTDINEYNNMFNSPYHEETNVEEVKDTDSFKMQTDHILWSHVVRDYSGIEFRISGANIADEVGKGRLLWMKSVTNFFGVDWDPSSVSKFLQVRTNATNYTKVPASLKIDNIVEPGPGFFASINEGIRSISAPPGVAQAVEISKSAADWIFNNPKKSAAAGILLTVATGAVTGVDTLRLDKQVINLIKTGAYKTSEKFASLLSSLKTAPQNVASSIYNGIKSISWSLYDGSVGKFTRLFSRNTPATIANQETVQNIISNVSPDTVPSIGATGIAPAIQNVTSSVNPQYFPSIGASSFAPPTVALPSIIPSVSSYNPISSFDAIPNQDFNATNVLGDYPNVAKSLGASIAPVARTTARGLSYVVGSLGSDLQ